MENISKVFGSLKANNNVNLSVRKGEVHALLGENGAGKSTLMNMLSGIYTPDTGSIKIDGQEVHFASPKDSIRLGIGMIHQHFKLVDVMTAKENIIIGQPSGFFVKGKLLSQEVKKLSDQYGLDIDPDKKVYDMSVGEKQTLEIIKVLYRGAKILIMDEPTAVLTPQEIKKLFRVIRNMKEQGCSVVIITHKLNEVMEISDRVTVLRKGESIGTVNTDEVNVASLIEMMVHFASPKDSIRLGIGMIHQHFKLVDVMTAKENIIIGQPSGFFVKGKLLSQEVKKLSDQYGLDIDPDKKVYDMSVGEKQTLEIIKVLYRGAKILIMDEPTAVLTPQEIKKLFRVIRNMKEQGCSVVIITHKLNEVMEISDRVTVLRKGESIGTVNTDEVNVASLIEMMVGKKVDLSIDKKKIAEKTPLLDLDEVTVLDGEGKEALANVSFQLNSHEIVGVAGVANSGQKELCEVIAGLAKAEKGRIFFEGDNLVGKTPRDIIRLGIRMGFIPEDRLGMGLVGSMDIVHNLILKDYQNQPGIVLRRGPCIKKANKIVKDLDIQTPDIYTPVKKLSGGNVQKVLLGREIDSDPKVLITAYAVRGLDIGASYKIYDLLNEQKEKGVGVLFVGEDLDVLMDLCDRIIVLCHGEITGIVDPDEVTKEDIGLLMTGKKAQEVDE